MNRVLDKIPVNIWEALVQRSSSTGFGAEPGQVQQGFGQGSGEGLGGFGLERRSGSGEGSSQVRFNRVLDRFRRRSGRLWCKARSRSTLF